MLGVFVHAGVGPGRGWPPARSCKRRDRRLRDPGTTPASAGFALVFLLLRAFSSGCAALTGVEAISNGVPAFRKPKGKNAATTLLLLGLLAVTMFCGVIALAHLTDAKFAEPSPAAT